MIKNIFKQCEKLNPVILEKLIVKLQYLLLNKMFPKDKKGKRQMKN